MAEFDEKDRMPADDGIRLRVRLLRGSGPAGEMRFRAAFAVGRLDDCEVTLAEACVSRRHAELRPEGDGWLLVDLGSANGTFLDGTRLAPNAPVALPDACEVAFGDNGPALSLETLRPKPVPPPEPPPASSPGPSAGAAPGAPPARDFSSETQIMRHYFGKGGEDEPAGEQTLMFRRAFERAHKTRSRKYLWAIGGIALLLLAAVGGLLWQKSRLDRMRGTAVELFYTMKSLELQVAQLEEIVLLKSDEGQLRDLMSKRQKLREMDKSYGNFLKELGLYKKMSEEDQAIFRMARLFGECEVNMPKGFVAEVKSYIGKWRATGRLKNGIAQAKARGFLPVAVKAFESHRLPPQYFFLGLQESGFQEQAVGPATRFGFAKGIWQFIPSTAEHYGLRVGPMFERATYDPMDERFNFEKATVAAARYLRDLNNSEAQASGLLAMASYNWGEGNVRQIIARMPENPKDRNFWRLLAAGNIPKETYDYVFYIFSASVINENPRLFGFDFESPVPKADSPFSN
jgi:soluble lytic murein transglycosylase-like protein